MFRYCQKSYFLVHYVRHRTESMRCRHARQRPGRRFAPTSGSTHAARHGAGCSPGPASTDAGAADGPDHSPASDVLGEAGAQALLNLPAGHDRPRGRSLLPDLLHATHVRRDRTEHGHLARGVLPAYQEARSARSFTWPGNRHAGHG